jgi:septal ring factor EnvC (AmiA/AmiB activator)
VSPLTKLFVVLLVLVSIVLTAGVVTFVNKLDPIQANLEQTKSKLAVKEELLARAADNVAAANARVEAVQADAAATAQALNTEILKTRAEVQDANTQVAALRQSVATLTSANASQASALASSEDSKTKYQEQVATLRKDADERLRQITDLNTRVSNLVAQNAVLERERRNLAEQVAELQGKSEQMGRLIRDLGGNEAMLAQGVGTRGGAPAINGVIRSVRNIAGKEYATISIGSQDQVTKGMEFKILDKESGAFLGVMTVDVVDANEAMGQIVAEPQNLAQIKAGNVVRTQI